jgi:hypothetical protein
MNEPVAWIDPFDLERLPLYDSWVSGEKTKWVDIPLYTHPAKTEDEGKVCARCGAIAYDPVITQTAKTLTDEEIVSCIDESEPDTTDMIRFARAILRKAQEK